MLQLSVTFRQNEQRYEFQQPLITFGRSRSAEIRLGVGTIAPHHVRILDVDGRIWLEDLRSTNGTWLLRNDNEERSSQQEWLRLREPTELRPLQTFRIGLPEDGALVTILSYAPIIDRDFELGFEAPFLKMLAADSNDDAARAVYADAVEEKGRDFFDRAEWLRMMIALHQQSLTTKDGVHADTNTALLERHRSLAVRLNTAPRWLELVSRKQ